MIYSFGGRDFYSFRDSFSVDFRVQPQAGEREIFHEDSQPQVHAAGGQWRRRPLAV